VTLNPAAWLQNFRATPWLAIVPLLGIVAPLLAAAGFGARRSGLTLLASKLGIACIIATAPTQTIRSPCSTPRRAVRRFATC